MQKIIEFIDNEKKLEEGDGQMMICTPCMSNYYLCDFLEIIDHEKIKGT
jgi:hypothetical protein